MFVYYVHNLSGNKDNNLFKAILGQTLRPK